MIARFLRRLFPRRPDPLEPNVEFIELLRSKLAEREDKLRRDLAVDAAMDVAHRHALADNRALAAAQELERMVGGRPKVTPYTRKLRLVKGDGA